MISDEAARWYLDNRGITKQTLEAFGAEGYQAAGPEGHFSAHGVIFTYPGGFKRLRNLNAEGDDRFRWLEPTPKGRIPAFVPPDFEQGPWMFLVEGETDCMAFWQHAPEEYRKGVVAVPGVPQFPRAVEDLVKDARKVFVVYDNDKSGYDEDAGEFQLEKSASEAGWEKVRDILGRKARRVVLPPGIKDVAEFFQQHSWAAFSILLRKAAEPVTHYKRLDLTQPVPDVQWVIEDLLVRDEAHVIAADGGIGKSWLCMAMALAVAGSDNTFLGLPVARHGKVVYVDEELSRDLALQRLNALGYDKDKHKNLEYVWQGGVDLWREPEKLLEEVCDRDPELVIIESLVKVSLGVKENDSGDMARIMKGAIVPLARESGAAVVVTHHTNAEAERLRGSTEIRNSADQTIRLKEAVTEGRKTGTINMFPDKPRREGSHVSFQINGSMKAGEPVVVELAPPLPF